LSENKEKKFKYFHSSAVFWSMLTKTSRNLHKFCLQDNKPTNSAIFRIRREMLEIQRSSHDSSGTNKKGKAFVLFSYYVFNLVYEPLNIK